MLPDYPWLDQSGSIGSDVFESGWKPLLKHLLAEIDALLKGSVTVLEILQVKEKLGSLRFYHRLRNASPRQKAAVERLMRAAYWESKRTCIVCGWPGKIRRLPSGLIEPLCDEHNNEDARNQIP